MTRVEIRADDTLSAEERALFKAWDAENFGSQPLLSIYTWAPAGWHAIVYEGQQPVSHLDITRREGLLAGRPLLMAGIGTVMTPAAQRGRGYARLALERSRSFIFEELNVETGLLICLPALCPFYARLGWRELRSPLVFTQPDTPRLTWPHRAMVLPREPAAWLDGPIDLCGLPW